MILDKLFSLKENVILLTGGYGHLGKPIAEGLSQAGGIVYVIGRDPIKFNRAFGSDSGICFEKGDVSSPEEMKTVFSEIYNKHGRIDTLINNAVYLKTDNKPDLLSDDVWSYGIDGTLNSVYRCIREVAPYMKKQGYGNIINIASMYGITVPDFNVYKGFEDFTNPPEYGTAKAGVIHLTKYFANYFAAQHIRVNCVSPGPFPSAAVQEYPGFIENLAKKVPLGRVGKPEELLGIIIYLSSNASSFTTGQNIAIDGGWTIF